METCRGNLFEALPDASTNEVIEPLLESGRLRIERIVSRGQASPDGFWYRQPHAEWVVVLRGAARIELADPDDLVELDEGGWIWLPAGRRHRVAWTDPARETLWLAVHHPVAVRPA